jgi:hypothetical protein
MDRKTHASAALSSWMKDEGRKVSWLADKAGVDRGAAGRWMRGIQRPHPAFRTAIEEITGGVVKASDWSE